MGASCIAPGRLGWALICCGDRGWCSELFTMPANGQNLRGWWEGQRLRGGWERKKGLIVRASRRVRLGVVLCAVGVDVRRKVDRKMEGNGDIDRDRTID